MSNDLWGEEEPFADRPEAAQTNSGGLAVEVPHQYAPPRIPAPGPALARVVAPTPPAPEPAFDTEVEAEQEPEEDFSEVLTDANLRLEQGMLYKAILNHNLFEGMESDPKAIQNVQREIRNFAKERMEVMLGMRRESTTVERLEIDFPFNALEVEVLKKLAFTATKGASENSDRYAPAVSRITEEIPFVESKRKTLNPIGIPSTKSRIASKPLQKSPAAPVRRTKLDATVDQIAREEGVPRELLEEDMPGIGGKSIDQMNATELEARNRLVSQRRGKLAKSPTAIPMATPEQTAMLAVERATQVETSMNSSPLMARLLDHVKKMPSSKA